MILVKVKQEYTDYLRRFDCRVSYNKESNYERPYVGVLFKIENKIFYFAPLTSSGKGKKLKFFPKKESITFYPIDNCKLGGINFNNMIPLVKNVYNPINVHKIKNSKLKNFYINQINELNSKEKHLKAKAHIIYNLKNKNLLYSNYDKVTCDFKLLESVAIKYSKKKK